MPIKVILFDADGVIQYAPEDWSVAFARLLPFENSQRAHKFTADIFAAETAFLSRTDGFDQALDDVLKAWRLIDYKSSVVETMFSLLAFDDVMEVVQATRSKGIQCFLASNQQKRRAAHMSDKFSYSSKFDGELYSCNLGAAKPSALYFERALEAAGVDAASTLFVDDRAENIAGASRLGLHTMLYDGRNGAANLLSGLHRFGIGIS